MFRTRSLSLGVVFAGLALSLAACSDVAAPFAPVAVGPHSAGALAATTAAQPTLLACATHQTRSATAVIGPDGGALKLGRTRVDVPAGAVASATAFTLAIPASPYMEIELSAAGATHYTFAAPVTVTIDYARCHLGPDAGGLDAWYIDGGTKSPLQLMSGTDDRKSKTIVFTTDHFSGYALAE